MIWLESDIELARKMYEDDGMALSAIAQSFRVSKRAVRKVLAARGVQIRGPGGGKNQYTKPDLPNACSRCGILLSEIGDAPTVQMCHWCVEELQQAAKRRARQVVVEIPHYLADVNSETAWRGWHDHRHR